MHTATAEDLLAFKAEFEEQFLDRLAEVVNWPDRYELIFEELGQDEFVSAITNGDPPFDKAARYHWRGAIECPPGSVSVGGLGYGSGNPVDVLFPPDPPERLRPSQTRNRIDLELWRIVQEAWPDPIQMLFKSAEEKNLWLYALIIARKVDRLIEEFVADHRRRHHCCVICGAILEGKRRDSKTCSPRCRKQLSRSNQKAQSGRGKEV